MLKLIFNLKLISIIAIVLLGFLLRYNNYTVWPRHGATFDEFAWTWLGINLIQTGTPISWSRHPQYKDIKIIKYQGAMFSLVKPYLEHPPLFGIVVGSFAIANGVSDMYHVTLAKIRPLALILGVLSIAMIFLLVKENYGVNLALLSSLLYATIPTVVVGSRIVQNENFLIPVWLFCLYLLSKYLKNGNKRIRNIAIIVASLMSLAKVPWFIVPISISLILAFKNRWKESFATFVISLLFFSLFIMFGIYYDKNVFFNLWQFQMARYDLSFDGLLAIFTTPLAVDRYYLDGWIYFGFMSMLLLAQDFKKHIFIIFPLLTYLLIFIFAIPNEPGHGWYRYPFYPFLIISISIFIKEHFFKNQILTLLFLTFTGLALFQLTWFPTFGFSYFILRTAVVVFSLPMLTIFFKSKKLAKIAQILNSTLFVLLIVLNIWAVFLYNEQ